MAQHALLGIVLGIRDKENSAGIWRKDVRTNAYFRASTLLIMGIVSMLYEYNRL